MLFMAVIYLVLLNKKVTKCILRFKKTYIPHPQPTRIPTLYRIPTYNNTICNHFSRIYPISTPRPESLLAELQLAFICFLVAQVWEGWEHWRKLVLALCSAEEFICQNPALYEKFLSALHFQVHEVCDGI